MFCYYGKLDKILEKINQNQKNNQNNRGCSKIIKEIICNLLPALYWIIPYNYSSLLPSIIYLQHKYYELFIYLLFDFLGIFVSTLLISLEFKYFMLLLLFLYCLLDITYLINKNVIILPFISITYRTISPFFYYIPQKETIYFHAIMLLLFSPV